MLEGEIISYWMGNRSMAGGYAIGIALEVDALSLFFGLLISTAVFVSCVYSFKYMSHDDNVPQYYTLFLMLAGGVMGLVLSGDIFNMFIMVEILTFAAVALTAFRNTAHGALEAAFKYLVGGCARRGSGLHLGAHLRRAHKVRYLRHHPSYLLPVPEHGTWRNAVFACVCRQRQYVRLRHYGAGAA